MIYLFFLAIFLIGNSTLLLFLLYGVNSCQSYPPRKTLIIAFDQTKEIMQRLAKYLLFILLFCFLLFLFKEIYHRIFSSKFLIDASDITVILLTISLLPHANKKRDKEITIYKIPVWRALIGIYAWVLVILGFVIMEYLDGNQYFMELRKKALYVYFENIMVAVGTIIPAFGAIKNFYLRKIQ
ncbi:hypothetical protein ACIQXV_17215 [Neobacillus sp. NPDC097160]|uniref:hypothetical protein n=1 Tax=Neobacillus sp. NPDC097160 TaxID=3364298 RepID=UPI00380D4DA8